MLHIFNSDKFVFSIIKPMWNSKVSAHYNFLLVCPWCHCHHRCWLALTKGSNVVHFSCLFPQHATKQVMYVSCLCFNCQVRVKKCILSYRKKTWHTTWAGYSRCAAVQIFLRRADGYTRAKLGTLFVMSVWGAGCLITNNSNE